MKTFDNNGRLLSEISHFRTADGGSITTSTQFNTHNGQPTNQNVTVFEPNGKVKVTNLINGKLLP